MKLGEITFFYSNLEPITEYYTSDKQRAAFISTYNGCTHYHITPYEGSGIANHINPQLKRFAAAVPRATPKGWKHRHEVTKEGI